MMKLRIIERGSGDSARYFVQGRVEFFGIPFDWWEVVGVSHESIESARVEKDVLDQAINGVVKVVE
jgi:hypothetical protein